MKSFKEYLKTNEASIEGNPGIPGQGGKREGENDYLRSLTNRKVRDRVMPSHPQEFFQLLSVSKNMIKGHEKELEALAEEVFLDIYKDIVERYDIQLDIKLASADEIVDVLSNEQDINNSNDEDSENDSENDEKSDEQKPRLKPLTDDYVQIEDEETLGEIHKRKIANLIMQGEAKNTKHVLHSDIVKDGLNRIYGEEDGKKIFDTWDKITKTADEFDWMIPVEHRKPMMKSNPENCAGVCKVEWKPSDDNESDDDSQGMGEEGDDNVSGGYDVPVIIVRALDFPMLLHESVKGLYEILSMGGIPEDMEMARLALINTGLEDEPEDWKYGPFIAADLRTFVNKNEKIDTYSNIREELWKMMVDKDNLTTPEFLELMRGILSDSKDARYKVDQMIDLIIEVLDEEEIYKKEMAKYQRDLDEYNKKMSKINKSDDNDIEKIDISDIEEVETDYSKLSPRELQEIIDNALDNGDYAKVRKLSAFLDNTTYDKYSKIFNILNEKKVGFEK